jgi:hypothetical protein
MNFGKQLNIVTQREPRNDERRQTRAPRQRRGGLQTIVAFNSSAVAWCYGVHLTNALRSTPALRTCGCRTMTAQANVVSRRTSQRLSVLKFQLSGILNALRSTSALRTCGGRTRTAQANVLSRRTSQRLSVVFPDTPFQMWWCVSQEG